MLPKGLPIQNLEPAQDSAGAKAPKKQGMSLESSPYKHHSQNHGCPHPAHNSRSLNCSAFEQGDRI